MPHLRSLTIDFSRAALLLFALLAASVAVGEDALSERYHRLTSGAAALLPGTAISLTSTERQGVVEAEVTSLLPHPFASSAPALAKTENWCQFMPLHFNIKACTYEQRQGEELLTLYSGRKTYQSPADSHTLTYRVERREQGNGRFALLLHAASGPAGTRDYRLEVDALCVPEGTLLYIRSSYRPSMTSALLTRSYLSTLGRDKVGFSRVERDGKLQLVRGVRGVIERNVMRYQLAIDTFLATQSLPAAAQHEAALKRWFRQNDSYPEQLHEMSEQDYLAIKRREWGNQQRLQQRVNERQRQTAKH